jgi:hypothetical protein
MLQHRPASRFWVRLNSHPRWWECSCECENCSGGAVGSFFAFDAARQRLYLT